MRMWNLKTNWLLRAIDRMKTGGINLELEKQNEGVQETALTAAEQGAAVRVETEGTAQETKRPRRRTPSRGRRIAAEAKTKETAAESSEDKGAARTTRRRTQNTRSQNQNHEGQSKRGAVQRAVQTGGQRSSQTGAHENGKRRELPAKTAARSSAKKGTENKEKLKIIPLGGLEQIGMNITAFEYGDSIVVVDCGMAFPGDDMLGIDLVIPDITYLKNNFDKIKAFVITHGHEDHIGALPYVLEQINVPVYATKLTMGLIEHKLEERGMLKNTKRKVVRFGQTVNLGNFKVEFIKTNHSIQDAAALAIFSPAGIVLHTGDFKIDYTPVFGDPIDLQRFAELGKKGVLALMADSTNATRPGFTMSERTVGRTFDSIFGEHTHQRIIVATFASNVDRVQQIVNTAYKYGRKVVVEGRSMVTVMDIAIKLGYIKVPEGTLIDIEQLKNYPPESTVLITTGSQGESMAALSRMAASIHKKVSIMPGDVVILSSTPIPGNEKAVSNVINELSIKGAQVIC